MKLSDVAKRAPLRVVRDADFDDLALLGAIDRRVLVYAGEARVHERAYIAPRSVRIGARVIVEPNATVLERVTIGDDTIVRAGAVVGSEGFEFKGPAMRQGRKTRAQWDYGTTNVAVPHAGSV